MFQWRKEPEKNNHNQQQQQQQQQHFRTQLLTFLPVRNQDILTLIKPSEKRISMVSFKIGRSPE